VKRVSQLAKRDKVANVYASITGESSLHALQKRSVSLDRPGIAMGTDNIEVSTFRQAGQLLKTSIDTRHTYTYSARTIAG